MTDRTAIIANPRGLEARKAREERALKPHFFRKWLVEAGLPATLVAAILEQADTAKDDEPQELDGRRPGLPPTHEPRVPLNVEVPPDVKQLVVRARAEHGVPMKVFVAKKLGWASIECRVLEGVDADHALLAEVAENLKRGDLSPGETADHEETYQTLYIKLYPTTKKGGAPGAGRGKKKREKTSQESQNETLVSDDALEEDGTPARPAGAGSP